MTDTDLIALESKVEGLAGPCRETDAEIMVVRGYVMHEGTRSIGLTYGKAWDRHPFKEWVRGDDVVPDHAVPEFTASLDAAMTLVPEGWGWLVSQPNEKAIASGLLKERTPVMGEVQYGCDQRFTVAAATPALALTAAALRAHAAQKEG